MRRNRENYRKKKIIGYVTIFLMFSSVFGLIFLGFNAGSISSGTFEYNNFKFINMGTHWSATIDGREALFTYLPDNLEFIEVDDGAINILKKKFQIDSTYEFNDTLAEPIALAQFQMGLTLNNFNIFMRNGFTSEYKDFPVITCDHATNFVPVIYFRSSNETHVYLENNCIIADASNAADVIRIKDRLVYGLLDVI